MNRWWHDKLVDAGDTKVPQWWRRRRRCRCSQAYSRCFTTESCSLFPQVRVTLWVNDKPWRKFLFFLPSFAFLLFINFGSSHDVDPCSFFSRWIGSFWYCLSLNSSAAFVSKSSDEKVALERWVEGWCMLLRLATASPHLTLFLTALDVATDTEQAEAKFREMRSRAGADESKAVGYCCSWYSTSSFLSLMLSYRHT